MEVKSKRDRKEQRLERNRGGVGYNDSEEVERKNREGRDKIR